jgi:hypothetical protein
MLGALGFGAPRKQRSVRPPPNPSLGLPARRLDSVAPCPSPACPRFWRPPLAIPLSPWSTKRDKAYRWGEGDREERTARQSSCKTEKEDGGWAGGAAAAPDTARTGK